MKFLDDLTSFFRHNTPNYKVGMDLEDEVVRIVQMGPGENGPVIAAHATFDFDVSDKESVCRRLNEVLDELGVSRRDIALTLEDPSIRIRRMVLPQMPDQDTLEAIKWNFREHIDVPMEEYVVGYVPLGPVGDAGEKKVSVLAYGVSRSALDERLSVFESSGCKVVSVEPVPSALLCALHAGHILESDALCGVVLLAKKLAIFAVMDADHLLFSRPLAGVGYADLLTFLQGELSESKEAVERAIAAWMEVGGRIVDDSVSDGEFAAVMRKFYSRMVIEIQRSIDAFCVLFGVDRIDKLILCGFGAAFADLPDYFKETLGISTGAFDPFVELSVAPNVTKPADSYLYVLAAGLAVF